MFNAVRKANTRTETSLFITSIGCIGEPTIRIHSTEKDSLDFVKSYLASSDQQYVTAYIFEGEVPVAKVYYNYGRIEMTRIYVDGV